MFNKTNLTIYPICFYLLLCTNVVIGTHAKKAQDLTRTIAKQYLNSFELEKKIEKTLKELEKERTKKAYEISLPQLSKRQLSSILLLKIYSDSPLLRDFLQKREDIITKVPPIVWESIKLFQGSSNTPAQHMLAECMRPGASHTETTAMAIRLATPITNIELLKKDQAITSFLVENPKLTDDLTAACNKLSTIEPSLLALYEKSLDPIWSAPYQKSLTDIFYTNNGKFTNWLLIEAKKRFSFEFSTLFQLFATPAIIIGTAGVRNCLALIKDFIDEVLAGNTSYLFAFVAASGYLLLVYGVIIYQTITLYKMYRLYNDYISNRLVDVQTLFETAQEINTIVKNNPALEANCAHKLSYTRKLLTRTHENSNYNKLADIFLSYNFKNWNLFFNSIATLLTTLTLLDDHIRALDEMLFEIGHIGTYLSAAHLIQNPNKYPNSFTYVEFLAQPDVYINFQDTWNGAIHAKKAIPNDILIDGAQFNTLTIMGPNACGKSIITQAVIKNALLAQALGITSAKKAKMTPIHTFYSFKEPKEDPTIQKSLFARELDNIKQHNSLLKQCDNLKQKSLTLYDEFLTSTNPEEASALQVAIILHNMSTYTNNVSIISTHNPYLIKALLKSKQSRIMHVVIDRHPDGTYTPRYTIAHGTTNEKVGIDLYEKDTKQKEIAREARKIRKKIEESQHQVK